MSRTKKYEKVEQESPLELPGAETGCCGGKSNAGSQPDGEVVTKENLADCLADLGIEPGPGGDGVTPAEAKEIAQQCIDDAGVGDDTFGTLVESTPGVLTWTPAGGGAPLVFCEGSKFGPAPADGTDADGNDYEQGDIIVTEPDGTVYCVDKSENVKVTVQVPDTAFADPDNPTDGEFQIWLATNATEGACYQYNGAGSPTNPDWAWNELGVNVEDPSGSELQKTVIDTRTTPIRELAPKEVCVDGPYFQAENRTEQAVCITQVYPGVEAESVRFTTHSGGTPVPATVVPNPQNIDDDMLNFLDLINAQGGVIETNDAGSNPAVDPMVIKICWFGLTTAQPTQLDFVDQAGNPLVPDSVDITNEEITADFELIYVCDNGVVTLGLEEIDPETLPFLKLVEFDDPTDEVFWRHEKCDLATSVETVEVRGKDDAVKTADAPNKLVEQFSIPTPRLQIDCSDPNVIKLEDISDCEHRKASETVRMCQNGSEIHNQMSLDDIDKANLFGLATLVWQPLYTVCNPDGTESVCRGKPVQVQVDLGVSSKVVIGVVSALDGSTVDFTQAGACPMFIVDDSDPNNIVTTQLDDKAAIDAHVLSKYPDAVLQGDSNYCVESGNAVDCPLTPSCCTWQLSEIVNDVTYRVTNYNGADGNGVANAAVWRFEKTAGPTALNNLGKIFEVTAFSDGGPMFAGGPGSAPAGIGLTVGYNSVTSRNFIDIQNVGATPNPGCGELECFITIRDLDTSNTATESVQLNAGSVSSIGSLIQDNGSGSYQSTSPGTSPDTDIVLDGLVTPVNFESFLTNSTGSGQFHGIGVTVRGSIEVIKNAAGDWEDLDGRASTYPDSQVTCVPAQAV